MSVDLDLVLTCLQRAWDWRGGPTLPLDRAMVAGYALAIAFAALVVVRAPFPPGGRAQARTFWVLVMLFLLTVGLARAFDQHLLITDTARCVAHSDGWYRVRRDVQMRYVLTAMAALALFGLALLWWLRRTLVANLPALAGCLVLAGLGAARAASIRELDTALRSPVLHVRLDRWIEIAGIALLIAGAAWVLRRRRGRQV